MKTTILVTWQDKLQYRLATLWADDWLIICLVILCIIGLLLWLIFVERAEKIERKVKETYFKEYKRKIKNSGL